LFLSIIFNGFPVLSFPACIVQIFRSPEKRWIEVSLYLILLLTAFIAIKIRNGLEDLTVVLNGIPEDGKEG
jgi:hypothetical protein